MTENIAFVGLGNMGAPMAANLLRDRGNLLVHDLRPAAAEALVRAGCRWAERLEDLAVEADVVVTSLPGPREIRDIAFGDGGLLSSLRPGSLWLDMSTNDPALARELASDAAARAIAFLDAPVTGGVQGAKAGTLTIMAGGEEADLETARPILMAMASRLVHCGPAGTGCAMKLIVNFLGITHSVLSAEALTLGRASGLATETMQSVLNGCWGHNAMLEDIVETGRGARHWDFAMTLAKKDMALAAAFAEGVGLQMLFCEVTLAALNAASVSKTSGGDLWQIVEDCEAKVRAPTVSG